MITAKDLNYRYVNQPPVDDKIDIQSTIFDRHNVDHVLLVINELFEELNIFIHKAEIMKAERLLWVELPRKIKKFADVLEWIKYIW